MQTVTIFSSLQLCHGQSQHELWCTNSPCGRTQDVVCCCVVCLQHNPISIQATNVSAFGWVSAHCMQTSKLCDLVQETRQRASGCSIEEVHEHGRAPTAMATPEEDGEPARNDSQTPQAATPEGPVTVPSPVPFGSPVHRTPQGQVQNAPRLVQDTPGTMSSIARDSVFGGGYMPLFHVCSPLRQLLDFTLTPTSYSSQVLLFNLDCVPSVSCPAITCFSLDLFSMSVVSCSMIAEH